MQNETEQYLRDFTKREDALLAKASELKLKLPERLYNWRFWIGDSQVYLNELRTFIETNNTL